MKLAQFADGQRIRGRSYDTFCPLEPGDVIATGTPSGVGLARTPPRYLAPGGEVTVTVGRICALTTPVNKA